MAKWSGNKVNPEQINNGNEYSVNDNLSVEALNGLVNNSINAQVNSERALKLAEGANKANGTVVEINGKPQGTWDATAVSEITTQQSNFVKNEYEKGLNLFDKNNFNLLTNLTFYSGGFYTYSGANAICFKLEKNTEYSVNSNYDGFYKTCFTKEIPSPNSTTVYSYGEQNIPMSFNSQDYEYLVIGELDTNGLQQVVNSLVIVKGTTIPNEYLEYRGELIRKADIEPLTLWENASPNSPFEAQTKALRENITKFKRFIVVFKHFYMASLKIGESNAEFSNPTNGCKYCFGVVQHEGGSQNLKSRQFVIGDDGMTITFETGYENNSQNAGQCIPLEILGFKY